MARYVSCNWDVSQLSHHLGKEGESHHMTDICDFGLPDVEPLRGCRGIETLSDEYLDFLVKSQTQN